LRKVTAKAVAAFYAHRNFGGGNTTVHTTMTETVMYLFGNPIAKLSPEGLEIQTAGWETTTTKERLNGLDNVQVWTENGNLYLNGKVWENSDVWTKV
jgi:hypothetical protein